MNKYKEILRHILANGEARQNRTGVETIGVFGYQYKHDLADGFPLLTTKRIYWNAIVHELLWFLRGDTNIKYLHENNVHIWDEWATADGDLGAVYGQQFRNFNGVDQLKAVEHSLIHNTQSRRHIISMWNPYYLPDESISPQDNVLLGKQALAPCHVMYQFHVDNDRRLSCMLYQRSCDVFLGLPHNLAVAALLTHLLAVRCGFLPGQIIHSIGDLHLYTNHIEQVMTLLSREPRRLPMLHVCHVADIAAVDPESIVLLGYEPLDTIKAEVAV